MNINANIIACTWAGWGLGILACTWQGVYPSMHWGRIVCGQGVCGHGGCDQGCGQGDTSPIPRSEAHHPESESVTGMGDAHPTGMHTCFINIYEYV